MYTKNVKLPSLNQISGYANGPFDVRFHVIEIWRLAVLQNLSLKISIVHEFFLLVVAKSKDSVVTNV